MKPEENSMVREYAETVSSSSLEAEEPVLRPTVGKLQADHF